MARPKLGEGETQRLQLKISEDEMTAIDDWRFANRIASRSEAVRRLCQIGIIFDQSRDELIEKLKLHVEKQKELGNALAEEITESGRYEYELDAVAKKLVSAFTEASTNNVSFMMFLSSLIRPAGIVRGEDGLSPESAAGAARTSDFFKGMVKKIEQGFPEEDK